MGVITIYKLEVQPFTDKQVALVETFADQAVIAIENVRLFKELEARNTELTEALEQQTATAEILRVISGATTDAQPAFEAIARSATRLTGALFGSVYQFDGELIHNVAQHNYSDAAIELTRRSFPTRPTRQVFTARAILERAVVHVPDVSQDQERLRARDLAEVASVLSVPMLLDGNPVGAITVFRDTTGPFSDKQVALLKIFADQAVIAIENVRLFSELQARNAELLESLERQTATAEILRLIGTSPTDAQPVFEGIARSGVKVLGALGCTVFILEGDMLRVAATHGLRRERVERLLTQFPAVLSNRPDFITTVREGVFHLADIEHNPDATPAHVEAARLGGYRTRLMAPMMRGDSVLGIIAVTREAPAPFPERQVELLKTFADQAVIAIENVRLFKELQARNAELTESLEQQTATGEILRVICSSPTDVQPIFDDHRQERGEAVRRAVRRAVPVRWRADSPGGAPQLPARGARDPPALVPVRPDAGAAGAWAIVRQAPVHVRDFESEPDAPSVSRDAARTFGHRSLLSVPMLREGRALGAISMARDKPGGFPDRQVELLQTFADQAVIAIENVRLFTELEARNRDLTEALEQQTATSEILRVISSSPTDRRSRSSKPSSTSGRRLCATLTVPARRLRWRDAHLARLGQPPKAREDALREHLPDRPARAGTTGRASCSIAPSFTSRTWRPTRVHRLQLRPCGLSRARILVSRCSARTGASARSDASRPRARAVLRQPDRPAADLRRPGRDRHRERAAVQGAGGAQQGPRRGPGAADGHRRHPARDQPGADGRPAGLRGHRGQRHAALRRVGCGGVAVDGERVRARRRGGGGCRAARTRCSSGGARRGRPDVDGLVGRTIIARAMQQVADVETDASVNPSSARAPGNAAGARRSRCRCCGATTSSG